MSASHHASDPRGQLIRPYAVTRGRTEPIREVALEAILLTTPSGRQEAAFAGRDKHRIASLCDGRALSLAEISSYLQMPLGVARVLVAEMVRDGLLALHDPGVIQDYDERMDLLDGVLAGLRKL